MRPALERLARIGLLTALRRLDARGYRFTPVSRDMLRRTGQTAGDVLGRGLPVRYPDEAEGDVLDALAAGLSGQELAAQAFLSPNTVTTAQHRHDPNRSLDRKLGVGPRIEGLTRARALGLRS